MSSTSACGCYKGCYFIVLNWFSLSQQVAIVTSILIKGGTLCPFLFLSAVILSGVNLYRSCVCCHSLCEFILCQSCYVQNMLFPWTHSQSLSLKIFVGSCSLTFAGGVIKISYLVHSTPKSLIVCRLSICGSPC